MCAKPHSSIDSLSITNLNYEVNKTASLSARGGALSELISLVVEVDSRLGPARTPDPTDCKQEYNSFMKMSDRRKDLRPREKLQARGAEALSDYELLIAR